MNRPRAVFLVVASTRVDYLVNPGRYIDHDPGDIIRFFGDPPPPGFGRANPTLRQVPRRQLRFYRY